MNLRSGIVGIAILGMWGAPALAWTPQDFTVQGLLRDGQGKLQTVAVDIKVTFYDASTQGNVISGPYDIKGVMAQNGLFTVPILEPQLKSHLANAQEVWMELVAGADTFARQKLTAQPYALISHSADEADTLSPACSGCVKSSMIDKVDAAKVVGKVAAAGIADTVTNGIYSNLVYPDPAWLPSLAAAKIVGKVPAAMNADTVTNGVYTTGMYADPSWITSLPGSRINGPVSNATNAINANTAVNFSGTLAGDVTGLEGATSVGRLQGVAVSTTAPMDQQVLKYNAGAMRWEPGAAPNGGGGVTSVGTGIGLSGGPITTIGTINLNLNANGGLSRALGAGNNELGIAAGAIVPAMVATGTYAISVSGNAGSAASFSGALAGDVTGTQMMTTVAKLQGVTVSTTVPMDGQVLKYNAATFKWTPGAETNSGGTVTSVGTGTGLTGGPVTSSGSIAISPTGVTAGTYGTASSVPTLTVNAQGQISSAGNTAIVLSVTQLTGVLGVANGGTGTGTALTPGSVVFAGANGVYSQNNGSLFWDNTNNRLGLGIAAPLALLHMSGGAVLADGTTGATPTSGAGTRMMWIPAKAAWRAGAVTGTAWDDANVGIMSVAFGRDNKATGQNSASLGQNNGATNFSAMALGTNNTASGISSVALGAGNQAIGAQAAAIGNNNTASGNSSAAIGSGNTASQIGSVALGSGSTASGPQSFAAGWFASAGGAGSVAVGNSVFAYSAGSVVLGANASDNSFGGSFVFGDSSGGGVFQPGVAANSFIARASGGVWFYSNQAATTGVTLPANSGSWNMLSDRNQKENFRSENGEAILHAIAAMPVESWNYRAQGASIRHLGPTAQDFRQAFRLGENNTTISTVDLGGVNLLAAQALERRTAQLEARLAEIEKKLASVRGH